MSQTSQKNLLLNAKVWGFFPLFTSYLKKHNTLHSSKKQRGLYTIR